MHPFYSLSGQYRALDFRQLEPLGSPLHEDVQCALDDGEGRPADPQRDDVAEVMSGVGEKTQAVGEYAAHHL